ncbi:hypothetical protein OIU74_027876 [Salix koriyanagi]|uniref:Uncharacterized protein n=1 Tax=Salix koriyanagi TaxID=2511006 RepID=A0A9Q0ZZX8_9ROSI|nr:hypothetical protein OIU74_027876 [Salix koriyanagi]
MGTEFLYKMYMPGYNSTKDLDDSSGNGSWPSHHENKAYEQHHGMLAANPEINRYSGYDKEHLRQTILRQENTFRHQVHELHRLHKIQIEIMNEVRSKGSVICLDPMRTFQSNPLTFSPKGDGISSINLQNMQSGCGSTHNVSTIKYDVSLEYNHKKLQRKLFDLELPADKYINDADEEKGAFGGSGLESDPPNWNCRVNCEKNGNMSTLSSVHSSCNGDTFSSNTGRTQGVTDLNKPFQVEEAYDTTPFLGKVTYLKEEIQGRDLSANSCSGFQSMEKEVSRRPFKEKEEGLSQQNMLLDNEWGNKSRPPFNFNSGHISTVTPSRNFYREYLPTQSESSHVGCMNAKVSDQSKPEQLRKKTIFGVEISNRNHNVSFMTSDALPPPPAPQSNVGNSESSSISSWKRPPSSLRQNAIFLQGNPCFNTFPESNKSSATLSQCHEVSADGSIVNEKVDFIPKPVVELSYKNDISLISQLKSKASAGHSNGSSASNFAFEQVPKRNPPNNSRASGWSENIKSAEEVNLNAVPPKSYPIEAISDSNHISIGIQEMEETPLGALSWMKTISHCNGKSSGDMSDFQQVNWDSLQRKYADQFACNAGTMKDLCQNIIQDSSSATNAHDAEEKRIRGDCSSNKKILCVPTFEKPISKDLPSASSGLKPGFCVSETTGANSIKVDCRANLRHSIDLNVSVTEEEAQAPRNKARIAIQIDLEAPIVLENDTDIVPGAEALVDISLSGVHQFQDDARCQILETEVNNPLQWFADIISSYKGYIKNDAGSLSVHKGNNDCEDSTPDEVDFFEYMTLNLTETMVEDPDYEPVVLENTKDETSLPRGRRRGQARRGRQRKDFQRDVLPGLVSLSRNDVTDDLQMIEGMIIATGGTWQSGLSQRNSPKRKAGRGRKRTASSAAVPTVTTVSPPQAQHPNCGELGLEVTGWGKRTRRPPRQRYPTNNPLPHQ